MAARTTSELLAEVEALTPEVLRGLRVLFAGGAAMISDAEELTDDLVSSSTVAGASGEWLDLLARSYGLRRGPGEADADLRVRIRNPDRKLTPGAILEGVNGLLAAYTATEAVLLEAWEDGPFYDQAFFDQAYITGESLTFWVVCPRVGDVPADVGAYYDVSFFDVATYAAGGDDHPVYASIWAFLQQARAAGITAYLIVDDAGVVL